MEISQYNDIKRIWDDSKYNPKLLVSILTRAREWGPELRAREGGGAEPAPRQLSSYES